MSDSFAAFNATPAVPDEPIVPFAQAWARLVMGIPIRPAAQELENPFATVAEPETVVLVAGWFAYVVVVEAGAAEYRLTWVGVQVVAPYW
ncbi:hypothetical protein ACWF0M_12430 [Kribbella sp. NPDC055110]